MNTDKKSKGITQLCANLPAPSAMAGITLGWVTALVFMHYPMLLSGMKRTQSDIGDSRLNNYFLEHSYRWITQHPQDSNFWSPLFFYPQVHTMAYSDLMLSFAPFYWCWRLIGLAPDSAFQFWMLTGTTLNFAVCLAWLRGCFRCAWPGAIVGAVFFTAAGPRATQLGHQQLQWQLYTMLALISAYKILMPEIRLASLASASKEGSLRWWTLLGFCILAQFWGAFYNGWFLMLELVLAGTIGLLWPTWFRRLLIVARRDFRTITAVGLATGLLLAPAAIKYLATFKDIGGHPYKNIYVWLSSPSSWIFPGPFSVERALAGHWLKVSDQTLEQGVSIGIFTTIAALAGLWLGRDRPGTKLVAIVGLLILCISTVVLGRYSLWWIPFKTMPGAAVIRAPSRIGLTLLIPASIGLAHFINHLWASQRMVLVAFLVAICGLEQACVLPSYDKAKARARVTLITAELPPNAKCFFYSGYLSQQREQFQIDAMWASLQSGIPTINGYSGSTPKDWGLADDFILPAPDDGHDATNEIQEALLNWTTRRAIDPTSVTWVRATGPTHATAHALVPATSTPIPPRPRWLRTEKFATTILAGILAGSSIFVGDALPDWLIR